MHYVYILQSMNYKSKIYIGNTSDLKRRVDEHNKGDNCSANKHKPFRIVYYEAYLNREDALERENKLKHHGSVIGHLKKRIKRSLITWTAKRAGFNSQTLIDTKNMDAITYVAPLEQRKLSAH